MKRLLIFLLGLSLAANAWLWFGRGGPAAAPVVRSKAKAAPVAPLPLAAIDAADVAALRAAGLDDAMVRAVVEGVLRRRHKEKLAEVRTTRTRDAWWRAGRTATAGDAKLLEEMVTEPLRRLLGPDPLEQADAEGRYSFLPLEKRRLLAQIDRDYAELQARTPAAGVNAQTQAEAKEARLLAEERRKDVLAALTPEERAEYDLRYAGNAAMVSRRAGTMGATEAEFRGLKPLIDAFDRESNMLGRDETFRAEAYEDLKRTTIRQLVETLGYDRAADYMWSAYDSEFGALRRAAEVAQLPASTPSRVMELMQETGRQAAAVHADAALSVVQKQVALVGLQQTTQAQLDALLPPAARRQLSAGAFPWLTGLSAGRYTVPMLDLLSSGGYMSTEVSTPLTGRPVERATLPPRPAGK